MRNACRLRHRRLRSQGRGLSHPPSRPPPKRLRLVVSAVEAGIRLGALLTGRGGLTPAIAESALSAGGVIVNRRRATRLDQTLQLRDQVEVHLVERGRTPSGPRPLDRERILHLDADLVVVDKPPFLAAQGTLSDASAGLDQAVSALLRTLGESNTFVGLVHRLDLETSGVTIFGRHPEAVRALSLQFRDSRVEKRYLAFVSGRPSFETIRCDEPIGPHPLTPGLQGVNPRGRPAVTEFRRLRSDDTWNAALLEARPRTGRTHQIRVHAAHLCLPLLGDRRYQGPAMITAPDGRKVLASRVALHASSIAFMHPGGRACTFDAPMPADLLALEKALFGERPLP